MNEILTAIANRYSCRDFASTPLTDEQTQAIVNAALAAPSGMNMQPWHLIVVRDKALIEEYDAAGMSILAAAEDQTLHQRMMDRGGKLLYNAPCMILILSNGSGLASIDCGIQCQTITLAAQSLGLGSCIVGMAGVPLNGPRADEFKKRLKIPEGFQFVIGVLIGTVISGKEPHELDYEKVTYIR